MAKKWQKPKTKNRNCLFQNLNIVWSRIVLFTREFPIDCAVEENYFKKSNEATRLHSTRTSLLRCLNASVGVPQRAILRTHGSQSIKMRLVILVSAIVWWARVLAPLHTFVKLLKKCLREMKNYIWTENRKRIWVLKIISYSLKSNWVTR